MEQEKTVAYFCPQCGSPSVTYGSLEGSRAECNSCSWRGANTELVGHVFEHQHGNEQQIIEALSREIRTLVGAHAEQYLKILVKWGFVSLIDGKLSKKEAARYLTSLCQGMLGGMIETRAAIEKERIQRGN